MFFIAELLALQLQIARQPAVTPSSEIHHNASLLGSPIAVGESSHIIPKPTRQVGRWALNEPNTEVSQVETEESPTTVTPVTPVNLVEVVADQLEYDQERQIITARGNVVMRVAKGVLRADRLQVNLSERLAVAEGNVILTRGEQILKGDRFEYFFIEERGVVINVSGEIYQPSLARDVAPTLSTNPLGDTIPTQPLSDRLFLDQPLRRVTGREGYNFVVGSVRDFNLINRQEGDPDLETGGNINRLRFQADRLEFNQQTWKATNIRITNDPYSPPELELRADEAQLNPLDNGLNELLTNNPRIVIDQDISLPTFQNRLLLGDDDPFIVGIGYDQDEKGGLFIFRSFSIVKNENVRFNITPEYYIQRSFEDPDSEGILRAEAFGFETDLEVDFTARTQLFGSAKLPTLNFSEIEDKLRAKLQLSQKIGELRNPYNLSLEYNYRERLFNGSLGFQTVYNSIGAVLTSPFIELGDSGIYLRYQASIQNIEADTDRDDLINNSDNDRVRLNRYQGAITLSKGFPLWEGEALPANPEQGLRYTPVPVKPFLELKTGITGVGSFYSNGDTQPSLNASVGIQGQIGHFSRAYLDYTGFNLTYSLGARGDASPFLFDRFVDTQTISLGITQQIYGPFRFGVQTSFNLDNNDDISTDYILEYSRRTHNIIIRYNPVLQIGSLSVRISDFNWLGTPQPFNDSL